MPNNGWREVFLEDVADELTVGYVGPMASEYVPSGIPFLRSQNVETLRVNRNDIRFITPEFHERIRKSALSPGDVVIVRTGQPGTCAVMPDSLPVANCSDLVIVRCGRKLDARFLAYYVNTIAAHHVSAHLVGAVQQHFNVGSARKLKMLLPEIAEQRAIASVLGALDDKIELNWRMNETLEAVALSLFKSWFVDSTQSALPKGWREGSVLESAELMSGGTPKTGRPDYWNGEILWASAKDVSQCGQTFLVATERAITRRGLEESATQLIPAYCTVVVARGATTGRMVMFGREMSMNQTCYALAGTTGTPFALYCQLRHEMDDLVHTAHGSVFDTITTSTFAISKVVLPLKETLERFEKTVSPLFRRILANTEESRTLAALRDALLPKLLSGELRVPENLAIA